MNHDEVNAACELLIEALANAIKVKNEEGAEVHRKGELDLAAAAIKQARSLEGLSKKVSDIQESYLSETRPTTELNEDVERVPHPTEGVGLTMHYNGAIATGVYREGRVTLREESTVRARMFDSLSDSARQRRETCRTDKTLVTTDQPDLLKLTRAITFGSPSGAAQFVAGCSVSGNRDWQLTGTHKRLGEWLREQK